MSNTARNGLQAHQDPQFIDAINRLAETMRAESDADLPHAYFIEEARLRLTGGTIHHMPEKLARPAAPETSACFDAWAKPGHET